MTVVLCGSPPVAAQEDGRAIEVPTVDVGLVQLEARRQRQLGDAESYSVLHDFRFIDRRAESGIGFRHRPTDDSARHYKMVHYDHGNGVAAGDVDGDGLWDLYFVNQSGANQLWRNRGSGRFEDVTATSAAGLPERVSVAAAFADIDNDGDPDLFVSTVKMGNVLFENLGSGRFRDISAAAGVGHIGHSSGAVFFDYDRDGLVDLFVTNVGQYTGDEVGAGGYFIGFEDAFQGHLHPERSERSLLYRNLGRGRFEDATERTGLIDEGWAGDASAIDLNGDGFLDLYVLDMQGDDAYYENQAGERFVEKRAQYFPKTPWGSMGLKFFDFDNNGHLDLLITDMHSDMSLEIPPGAERDKAIMMWSDEHLEGGTDNIFGNALYRNSGTPPLEEVSDELGAENYWPWGLSTGDLNADGWDDVFIAASMNYPFRYGINSVLLNGNGEQFLPSEFVLGVEPRTGPTRVPWFEVDCSSEEARSYERLKLVCGGRRGTYTVLGNPGTRSSVILDLDGDRDLDIVTGEFGSEPQVLISDLAQRHPVRAVAVRLIGTLSNRGGLGATVTVVSGDRRLVQVKDGKSGYLAQSDLPLYFGLGSGSVDRIEVSWPSGRTQVVSEGLDDRYLVEIEER